LSITTVPHWDLTNVYPELDSNEFELAVANVKTMTKDLELFFSVNEKSFLPESPTDEIATAIGGALDRLNALLELSRTIHAYIQSFVATNSRNSLAMKKLSEFEQAELQIETLNTRFLSIIGKLSSVLNDVIPINQTTNSHAFGIRNAAEQSKFLMSESEESLASELKLSGASAWSKLQGTLTSQLSVNFELDGHTQCLPMPAIINLHSHPDESIRRSAYETEMSAWKSIEEPLAAALNGIKGTTITLNQRRGRLDALHSAIDNSQLDRPTLDAMLSAMQDSFPMFRKYFRFKARRLGKEKLAWWDIFAPVGNSNKTYSWSEASDFIMKNFAEFSPVLSSFAKKAFDNNWIDGEQRDGKRGGAFCMSIPAVKESRVLCNFDETLDQVSTIAHELGHAFHNECAFKAGKTQIQKNTPMTLAETASIMCENIIMEAAIKQAEDQEEKLAILETRLIGDAQVIVDIYSRFLFEKEVFERRAVSELSAQDLCEIMEYAQMATYGDGLDDKYLMKYMWTWKPHYYSAGLSFYNFPYAFGLLFATGLYAIYQQRGKEFIPDYFELLANTGEGSAAELASRFGINIREKKFWSDSLSIIGERIELYTHI